MMKKVVLILVCVTIALVVAIGAAFAQAKAGVVGAWTGYAIVGDGSRFDFNFTVGKGDEGLTGKITEETGMVPEIVCRNMVFAENKLTFDIDFPNGMDLVLIKIALVLDGDTLKGFWTDPDGSSDIIELSRKK
jgi:hypothetical protein